MQWLRNYSCIKEIKVKTGAEKLSLYLNTRLMQTLQTAANKVILHDRFWQHGGFNMAALGQRLAECGSW